jgi:NAD(P)-dependent dehydrogenase (short-subunit alcohol dehydrogenase family)
MNGSTVVVTGASRGIGAAVARAFASAGANVVACARETEALDPLVEHASETDGSVTAVRADVRDEFDVERLMEQAARVDGPIDVVVANAGLAHGTPGEMFLEAESYSRFDDTMRTNVRGVFATFREAVPHLAADARVLVPSGSVAREATPGMGSYAVSKAAAEALVRGFDVELDQTVLVVDPGLVSTGLTGGQGRDPDDVADLFVWAAQDLDPAALDERIVDLRTWRQATR